MEDGMVMNQPTIFGYNAKTNQFMAGGEAGSETVVGTDSLMEMIMAAVSYENQEVIAALERQTERFMEIFSQYFPMFANMQLVTDTGALVGEIAPAMDEELGLIAMRKGR
jgi:hypothetical protein